MTEPKQRVSDERLALIRSHGDEFERDLVADCDDCRAALKEAQEQIDRLTPTKLGIPQDDWTAVEYARAVRDAAIQRAEAAESEAKSHLAALSVLAEERDRLAGQVAMVREALLAMDANDPNNVRHWIAHALAVTKSDASAYDRERRIEGALLMDSPEATRWLLTAPQVPGGYTAEMIVDHFYPPTEAAGENDSATGITVARSEQANVSEALVALPNVGAGGDPQAETPAAPSEPEDRSGWYTAMTHEPKQRVSDENLETRCRHIAEYRSEPGYEENPPLRVDFDSVLDLRDCRAALKEAQANAADWHRDYIAAIQRADAEHAAAERARATVDRLAAQVATLREQSKSIRSKAAEVVRHLDNHVWTAAAGENTSTANSTTEPTATDSGPPGVGTPAETPAAPSEEVMPNAVSERDPVSDDRRDAVTGAAHPTHAEPGPGVHEIALVHQLSAHPLPKRTRLTDKQLSDIFAVPVNEFGHPEPSYMNELQAERALSDRLAASAERMKKYDAELAAYREGRSAALMREAADVIASGDEHGGDHITARKCPRCILVNEMRALVAEPVNASTIEKDRDRLAGQVAMLREALDMVKRLCDTRDSQTDEGILTAVAATVSTVSTNAEAFVREKRIEGAQAVFRAMARHECDGSTVAQIVDAAYPPTKAAGDGEASGQITPSEPTPAETPAAPSDPEWEKVKDSTRLAAICEVQARARPGSPPMSQSHEERARAWLAGSATWNEWREQSLAKLLAAVERETVERCAAECDALAAYREGRGA